MRSLLIFLCLVAVALSHQHDLSFAESAVDKSVFAVDISRNVSVREYACIRNSGYLVAFIRGYYGNYADENARDNILAANATHMGVEVFVDSLMIKSRTGAYVFELTQGNLITSKVKINLYRVWLKVTNPSKWSSNSTANLEFINSFIDEARKSSVEVGIMTNWYDWLEITGGASVQQNGNVLLRYWSAFGQGKGAESMCNLTDFRPFGYWQIPDLKQIGIAESVCGVSVNRSCLPTTSLKNGNQMKLEESTVEFGAGVVVGEE